MRFRVLGALQLLRDDGATSLGSERQRVLLAALLISANRLVTFDRLVDVLWGPDAPRTAHRSLHSHVSRLRSRLDASRGRSPLQTRAAGYVLEVHDGDLDAHRFEALTRRAGAELRERPAQAIALLDEALGLWRGPAYVDVADEEFARPERRRLEELRVAAQEDRAEAHLVLGCERTVLGDLEALVARHPLRERTHQQLLLALHRCGRSAEALERYRTYRDTLAGELGLDPSPALQQLQREILDHAPRLTPAPAGRLQQPAPSRVRAAAPLPVPGGSPALTSFVGRDGLVARVAAAMAQRRVVTLVGPGGVGKTRLAEEVARIAGPAFPDGVATCELAPVREPQAVPHAVATALGVREPSGDAEESVVAAIGTRHQLLLVDNCEHVLPAVAALLTRLLSRCPHIAVLTTSRERLAVHGERVWPIPPLEVPPAGARRDEVRRSGAVALFADRASAADPSFVLDDDNVDDVAEVCRRLDGLPLAIELAAARARALSPRALAKHVQEPYSVLTAGPRGSGGRHRTLRAVVEWSYGLLSEQERRLFERLSVFAGGFTLDAAERVCVDRDVDAAEVAGLLANLVDKSMVRVHGGGTERRYSILETLREYGAQRLDARGERDRFRRNHATYYTALAEEADRDVRGAAEATAVALLERELANLRAAHGTARTFDEAHTALRLSAALHAYAVYRMRNEVHAWAEAAAEMPGAAGDPLRALVYASAALGAGNRGELERSERLARRALEVAVAPRDVGRAAALIALATAALYAGRLEASLRFAREAMDVARSVGDAYHLALAHIHEPLAAAYRGNHDLAVRKTQEQHALAAGARNPTLEAWANYADGEVLLDDDAPGAAAALERAADLARGVQNRFAEGVALVSLTSLRSRAGDDAAALRLFGHVIRHWRQAGDRTHQWTTLRNLVELLAQVGDRRGAAVLLGATTAGRGGAPAFGELAERLEALGKRLGDDLGDDAFEDARRLGASLVDDDVVAFALEQIATALARRARPVRPHPGLHTTHELPVPAAPQW